MAHDGRHLWPASPGVAAIGQGGLLDIARHARFADNRLLYFTYAVGTPQANRLRVARGVFENDELRNVQTLYEARDPKTAGLTLARGSRG